MKTGRSRELELIRYIKYRQSIKGKIASMWSGINSRVGNKHGDCPTYANTKLLMTRKEFSDWITPVLEEWIKTKPLRGMQGASVDRKDANGHYELSNLQIISNADNSKKKFDNRNINPPEGKAWCGKCKDYLSRAVFFKHNKNQHGLSYLCKSHDMESRKLSRARKKIVLASAITL